MAVVCPLLYGSFSRSFTLLLFSTSFIESFRTLEAPTVTNEDIYTFDGDVTMRASGERSWWLGHKFTVPICWRVWAPLSVLTISKPFGITNEHLRRA